MSYHYFDLININTLNLSDAYYIDDVDWTHVEYYLNIPIKNLLYTYLKDKPNTNNCNNIDFSSPQIKSSQNSNIYLVHSVFSESFVFTFESDITDSLTSNIVLNNEFILHLRNP